MLIAAHMMVLHLYGSGGPAGTPTTPQDTGPFILHTIKDLPHTTPPAALRGWHSLDGAYSRVAVALMVQRPLPTLEAHLIPTLTGTVLRYGLTQRGGLPYGCPI